MLAIISCCITNSRSFSSIANGTIFKNFTMQNIVQTWRTVIIYSTSMSYSLHLWFLLTTMNSFYEWLWMQHRFEFYVPNSENMTLNLSYIFSPRGDVFFIISFYALKVTLDDNYECILEGWAFSNLFAVVIAGNCLLV